MIGRSFSQLLLLLRSFVRGQCFSYVNSRMIVVIPPGLVYDNFLNFLITGIVSREPKKYTWTFFLYLLLRKKMSSHCPNKRTRLSEGATSSLLCFNFLSFPSSNHHHQTESSNQAGQASSMDHPKNLSFESSSSVLIVSLDGLPMELFCNQSKHCICQRKTLSTEKH